MRTRPEPTIIGNCDWLELHCRQKVWGAKSKKLLQGKVARQQQKVMHRLVTILRISSCTTCGWPVEQLWGSFCIPYGGFFTYPYICNHVQKGSILTKVIDRPAKLVLAHFNTSPLAGPKISHLFFGCLQNPSEIEGCF